MSNLNKIFVNLPVQDLSRSMDFDYFAYMIPSIRS